MIFLFVPRLENLYQHVPDFLERKRKTTYKKFSSEHEDGPESGLVVLWAFEESRKQFFKVLDDDGGEIGILFVEISGHLRNYKINTIPRHKTRCLFTSVSLL